ncbi:MAG: hypothetical protein MH252_11255 [Thermosynechococcaceae cyanobacterium MS004]|nr:hypothetical protein [Thermosynechococcaceae cyanobacterium MS004]
MHSHFDASKSPRSAQKVSSQVASKFPWRRKERGISPLKQRMEAVLKGDRQSIQDPLAHLSATYFVE